MIDIHLAMQILLTALAISVVVSTLVGYYVGRRAERKDIISKMQFMLMASFLESLKEDESYSEEEGE